MEGVGDIGVVLGLVVTSLGLRGITTGDRTKVLSQNERGSGNKILSCLFFSRGRGGLRDNNVMFSFACFAFIRGKQLLTLSTIPLTRFISQNSKLLM